MNPLHTTLCLLTLTLALTASAAAPFKIEVVDADNGWPVPLVALTTTHHVTFITDNAGVVAIDLPELMDRETWFSLRSDGYELPKDGFGNRGARLTPVAGKAARIEVRRTIIARRLGRLTGGGLFSESQELGEHLDWSQPARPERQRPPRRHLLENPRLRRCLPHRALRLGRGNRAL